VKVLFFTLGFGRGLEGSNVDLGIGWCGGRLGEQGRRRKGLSEMSSSLLLLFSFPHPLLS